jgi:hypothetical protein
MALKIGFIVNVELQLMKKTSSRKRFCTLRIYRTRLVLCESKEFSSSFCFFLDGHRIHPNGGYFDRTLGHEQPKETIRE